MTLNDIKIYINVNPRLTVIVFVFAILIIAIIINDENFIAEIVGISIAVLFIEWLLNGPNRVIYNTAKFDIESIKYIFYSRLLGKKGFEEEQYEYFEPLKKEKGRHSMDEMIIKATDILGKLKEQDYKSKFKDYNKNNFDGLNNAVKLLLDDLNKFKNNYFLSIDDIERNAILKCIKSSEALMIYSSSISKETKTISIDNLFLSFVSYNLYDIVLNINDLHNRISNKKGFQKFISWIPKFFKILFLFWSFINVVLLIFAKIPFNSHGYFFPFGKYRSTFINHWYHNYDISEFVGYFILPILGAGIIYLLKSKK